MVKDRKYDAVVIGGGPGGMAAAARAAELGIKRILLIERDLFLGGILPQCIHSGFGVKIFKKELTGPQYCQLFIDKIKKLNVDVMLGTMVLSIDEEKNIIVSGKINGIEKIQTKSIILSLGCRERARGQLNIPGTRPSGIFTAGVVQRMVNIEGYLPGRDIIILGSGDIGLIMARRLTLEGCNVKGVYELMPFSTGLIRNIAQCLEDYDIPLFISHTVTKIYGNKRIEAVRISKVDGSLNPIRASGKKIPCDTLLLSVGLIPENELSKTCGIKLDSKTNGPIVDENLQTSMEGIFACGNSLYVNDLVDNVTVDGYVAAESALNYLRGWKAKNNFIDIKAGKGIAYVVPQRVSGSSDVLFRIRPGRPARDANVVFSGLGYKKKVKYVNPGELVFIKIKKEQFGEAALPCNSVIEIDIKS